jgi:GxxExxY protein
LTFDEIRFPIVTTDLGHSACCGQNSYMTTPALHRLTAHQISHAVVTAAMRVHSELGPGLLESAYNACLQFELNNAGVASAAQVGLPVVYRGIRLDLGYRMDLIVEDLVVVEIKSVDALAPVHQGQILSYLKLSGKSLGLLINFNVVRFEGWHQKIRDRNRMEVKASPPRT